MKHMRELHSAGGGKKKKERKREGTKRIDETDCKSIKEIVSLLL